MVMLNKLVDLPSANSSEMRAYMQAILEVTGLFAGQRFPLELFMKNYGTHLAPKSGFSHATLEKAPDGFYALTAEGKDFFSSRLTADPVIKGQRVSREEVISMISRITREDPAEGWQSITIQLDSNSGD